MRNSPFWFVFIALMILLDFYIFQVLKVVSGSVSSKTRSILFTAYWALSILALVVLVILPFINFDNFPKGFRNTVFAIVMAVFFAKLIAGVFFLIDDFRRLFQWVAGKVFFSRTEGEQIQETGGISRSVFLSWLGLAAGGTLLTSLVYGLSNKYAYRIKRVPIHFPNLPQAFRGLKVVQLSDIHSGSLTDKAAVQRGIQKVMALQPDLILFTGDLVNNTVEEMTDFTNIFGALKAPMGVYSVLGNHDYGDYVQWATPAEKVANLERLKGVHASMGWQLMMNENKIFDRKGEKIALLGIENWGAKARFPKYGRMSDAHTGTEGIPFKILMSHDPSHWDAEVLTKYKDVDLTLSGHTHGMQFGVEIPWLKWSPVQYVYKQWAGLYESGAQKLYVNRGFGFLGYPGRVGILPEITLFELS
ncbi:MAG: mismatch repair protein MutT [Flaviaesturariibacter sp.]|nr:mismatch repair protein MutT [Flaviaesturariibacter sp.]